MILSHGKAFFVNKFTIALFFLMTYCILTHSDLSLSYAFMGLELHGHAEKNANKVYISPQNFQEPLKDAVLFLARRGLPVSIYNIPLCLCHNEVKNFARQSISGWKNIYLPVCDECEEKLSLTLTEGVNITLLQSFANECDSFTASVILEHLYILPPTTSSNK